MAVPTVDIVLFCLTVACWGCVWCLVLTREGGPFVFLRLWVIRALRMDRTQSEWRMGLYKILLGCPACHAGQVALWWMLIAGAKPPTTYFFSVTLTIFFAKTLEAFAAKFWN
jgi:hypothetical protein